MFLKFGILIPTGERASTIQSPARPTSESCPPSETDSCALLSSESDERTLILFQRRNCVIFTGTEFGSEFLELHTVPSVLALIFGPRLVEELCADFNPFLPQLLVTLPQLHIIFF